MGYTTEFRGEFKTDRPMGNSLVTELHEFSETRRCRPDNYNLPPEGQPGLWCNWVPNEDGTAIVWNEAEKFYNYIEWLEYIIEHFIRREGHKLNGEVEWFGEDSDDRGKIIVIDNVITVWDGHLTFKLRSAK